MTTRLYPTGHRVLTAVIALNLLLAAGAGPLYSPLDSSHDCAGVLPDSSGTISEILLHYDPELAVELTPLYRDFLGSLPDDVRVVVLCPSEEAAQGFIDSWQPMLRRRTVYVINVGLPVTVWARDRYISRQYGETAARSRGFVPVTYETYEPEKHNDLLVLELLGQSRIMPSVLDSALHVEGGNVVANKRHVFIGANILEDNEEIAQRDLVDEMERLAGREYVLVSDRSGQVPWCHVDMYMTPVTEDIAIVASPRMALNLMSTDAEEEEQTVDRLFSDTCVADPVQRRFDDVAAFMRRRGYRVYRLPAIIDVPDESMITYTNVIMDRRDGRRIIYMPIYHIPDLDDAAAALYHSLGFEVRTVDVSEIYPLGGAVRCLVNVTQRRRVDSNHTLRGQRKGIWFMNLAGSDQYEHLLYTSGERLATRGRRHNRLWSALP